MLQVKRWAKQYLMLSPIFKHNIFNLPNNEHIMRVNPRLLSAYCLKMFKDKHYNHKQITAILQSYHHQSHSYWQNYVYSIIHPQTYLNQHITTTTEQPEDKNTHHSIEQIQKLRHLIAKTFHQQITRQQFSQMAQLYLTLLDHNNISEIDNFAIDLSLFKLEHLVTFTDMKESALAAIGNQSICMLQSVINASQPARYFSIISVLNRLRNRLDNYPRLQQLAQLITIQTNHKQLLGRRGSDRVFLSEQSIVFMVWLLHMYQVGQFMYLHVRRNYLLMDYHEHSLKLISRLLNAIEVDDSMQQQHVVLLSQVVSKLNQLHKESDIWQQFEQNLQLHKTVNRLKTKINQLSHKHQLSNTSNKPLQLLQQLNHYQIDFHSTYSQKFIKHQFAQILADPYSAILLSRQQINCLLELALKVDSLEMHSKLTAKFKNHIQTKHSHKLIDYLIGMEKQEGIDVISLSIDSICELRRVKQCLSSKSTALNKLKLTQPQILYLQQLQLLLTNPQKYSDTVDSQLLNKALAQFQL